MRTYSKHFSHIMKSLDSGQFRTVRLGDSIESVTSKEAENELFKGKLHMPFIEYFVKSSADTKQYFKVMYLYETDVVDHIQFSFEYKEFDHGLTSEEFTMLASDFVEFFNQTYGSIVEKGRNSLGNRGRETYQMWRSNDEKRPLQITLVTQFKPKEKEASYLQVTFAPVPQ